MLDEFVICIYTGFVMSDSKKITIIALVVGILVGGFAVYAGLNHNPQGEFFDPQIGLRSLHVGYTLFLFLSWFVPVFIVSWLGMRLAVFLYKKID